jgi:phage N-6-adenine-methyltransferase
MMSSKTDLWATPQGFFNNLNAMYQFDLDVCATPENAKCENYFTPDQDGLKQIWGGEAMLDESALWPRDRQVVEKSLRIQFARRYRSLLSACAHRYRLVA